LVVVAILGILAAVAAPNFASFMGTINSKSVALDLVSDLVTARGEAIKRNDTVTLAPLNGTWSKGWQVTTGTGTVLKSHDALKYSLTLTGASSAGGVVFQPNGRLAEDDAPGNLTWLISSTISGVTSRCVVITPTGSARSKMGAC
jgi:type IV fimbrial biogenesis protein FimT